MENLLIKVIRQNHSVPRISSPVDRVYSVVRG